MTIEQADKQYHEYLEGHIGNVQEALELLHTLGIQFIDDNYEELKSICQNHDASKYSDEEYIPYREHFYPTCDEDKLKTEAFELACRHHIKNNKHHWDYWLDENNQLDIPDEQEYKLYCVERCCDWLAMSCQHDEPSSAWYHANKESIQMPDYGWELCDEIMSKVPEKCDFTFKGTRGELDESYIQPRDEERTYTLYHCSSSPNISEFNELHFEENSLGGTTYGNAIYFADSIEAVLTYNSRRRKYIYECNVQCKHVISSREYSIILSNEDKKRDFDNTVWSASERRKVMLEHNIDAVDDLPSELAVFNLDCIKSVKLIKSLNESYAYARDVTTKELDRNHVMFITYGSYGEHVEHFDNVARLFDYIKSCGGFKEFKGIMWFIKSDYKDGEFYLVRDRYHKGGWKWEDVNGSIVDAFDSKTFAIKPDKKAAVKQMYNAGDGTFMIDLNDGWVTDYGTNYIQATDKNDAILELNHRVSYIGSNNEMNESSDYWKSLKPQIEDTENDRKGVEMYKEKISNGYHRPILVNKNNEILDGNHTMTAYQELGIEPKMLYRGERSDFYKAAAETKGDAEKAIHVMIDNGTAKLIESSSKSKKQTLVDFVNNANSAEIQSILYYLANADYIPDDTGRKGKQFILDVIKNNYVDEPSTSNQKKDNTDIEVAICNGTHKDRSEYLTEELAESFGNSGYVGQSKSVRAFAAEEEEKYPASECDKLLGVRSGATKAVLSPSEWHHTGSYYKETDYYDIRLLLAIKNNDEEVMSEYNEDEIKEAKQKYEDLKQWKKPELQSNTYKADVEWLTWSGTRKHPKAEEHKVKNTEVTERGSYYYFKDEYGIDTKKMIGSNGTRVRRIDESINSAITKGDAEKAIHVMIKNGTAKQINEAVGPSKEYLKKNFKKVKFNSNFSSAEIVTEEYEPIPKSLKGWIYNNQFPHYPLEDNNGKQYMYHNTDAKNIPSIIENGLRTGQNLKSYSKSPEEGNVIWCDDNNAESSGFGGSTVVFSIPKEDAEKYKVNSTQYAIPYDILPKDILFIDRLICSQPSIKVSDIPAYVNKFGKDKVIDVISKKNPDCPIVDIIGRASEKNLIESFKVVNRPGGGYLLEASMKQLKRKTLSEDPTRAKKSKHVQSKYIGISKYGVLNFETTSETHSGVTWYQEVHFPSFNGFMNIIEEGDVIEAEDVKKAMSSDNIKISCFTEDTEVQTLDGMKKIKDIKVGDKVLTHTGKYQDVLQTFENDYNGEMIEINGVKSTPNHPYLVKLPNGDIEWKMACEITKDMKLLEVEE